MGRRAGAEARPPGLERPDGVRGIDAHDRRRRRAPGPTATRNGHGRRPIRCRARSGRRTDPFRRDRRRRRSCTTGRAVRRAAAVGERVPDRRVARPRRRSGGRDRTERVGRRTRRRAHRSPRRDRRRSTVSLPLRSSSGNVIVAASRWVVIDWITVSAGPPDADFARTLVLDPPHPRTPRGRFMEIVEREGVKVRGLDRSRLDAWIRIIAAARLSEGFEGEHAAHLTGLASGTRQ